MSNIEVKINRRTRKVKPEKIFIGLDGENLQENVIFSFEDEFVEGQARLDIEFRDGTKGQITELKQVGETYVLPIKSEITKFSGCSAQLVIDEGTDENSIPIFKSMYVGLIVAESINAVMPVPEGYAEWIDSANAKLNQIDEKIEEVDTAVEQVNNAVERVDEGLSDLTHANEEAREIVSNFEDNVENYTSDFNTNADNKTNSFNSNYESKLRSFDSNASDKTTTFNDNADSKLSSYNSNANSKIGEYNSNAETKKNDYDTNASSKLNEYNTNATTKLEEYNTNASTKLEEYNQNASEKIVEYDNHVAEMQNTINKLEDRVDDLEDNQITLPAEGTNIHVDNAAKARLYEFELEKESSQHTTSGKNLIGGYDYNRTSNGITFETHKDGSVTCNGTSTGFAASIQGTIAFQNNWVVVLPAGTYTLSGGISNLVRVDLFDENSDNVTSTFSSKSFTLEEDKTVFCRVYIASAGKVLDNITVYPQLEVGDTATEWEEYTNGPSPNPDYPQEVKTVKGYRNLFNGNNVTTTTPNNWGIEFENDILIITHKTTYTTGAPKLELGLLPAGTYKLTGILDSNFGLNINGSYSKSLNNGDTFTCDGTQSIDLVVPISGFASGTTREYKNVMLVEGDQELPYVPYGNNYIAVNVSDGTNTNSIPLPLNGNEIVGIGNYLDEYIVDKSGHCWLNKLMGKVVLDGSETYTSMGWSNEKKGYRTTISDIKQTTSGTNPCNAMSNYYTPYTANELYALDVVSYGISNRTNQSEIIIRNDDCLSTTDFKNWLSTHNTEVYYVLAQENLIDLQTTVDLKLFKGVNNITNSEDGNMRIRYVESIESVISELRNAILEIGGGE